MGIWWSKCCTEGFGNWGWRSKQQRLKRQPARGVGVFREYVSIYWNTLLFDSHPSTVIPPLSKQDYPPKSPRWILDPPTAKQLISQQKLQKRVGRKILYCSDWKKRCHNKFPPESRIWETGQDPLHIICLIFQLKGRKIDCYIQWRAAGKWQLFSPVSVLTCQSCLRYSVTREWVYGRGW